MQLPGGTRCSTPRRPSFTAPIRCPASTPHGVNVITQLRWRRRIGSLNYPFALQVPQDDHNGFAHQDPGVLGHVSKKAGCGCTAACCWSLANARTAGTAGMSPLPGTRAVPVADHGRDGRALHRGHRHLGLGNVSARAPSPTP
ncbi:MAG: hypothetical protein ACLPKI_20990 [Streptosporangiaceae bacterium]